MVESFLMNLWMITLDAAPWLLFGLVVAGLLKAFLPTRVIGRWLGGKGPVSSVIASVIGAPLPLCSCSVLPAAMALRRQGASRGATVSFLISTPENGADSVALSYALLGPFMAVARPVAGIVSAVASGVATSIFADPAAGDEVEKTESEREKELVETCCGSGSAMAAAEVRRTPVGVGACCGGGDEGDVEGVGASDPGLRSQTRSDPACCGSGGGGGAEGSGGGSCGSGASEDMGATDPGLRSQTRSDPACCGGGDESGGASAGDPDLRSPKAAHSGPACCEGGGGSRAGESCCADGEAAPEAMGEVGDGWVARCWDGVRYAVSRLYDDLLVWLVVGLVLAAVVRTVVGSEAGLAAFVAGFPNWLVMVVMLVVGVPMYICATSSTPFAAALLFAGLSPGAVMVFLLAGPATNLGSLGIIRNEIGTRAMVVYLAGIGVCSLAAGFAVDWLVGVWSLDIVGQAGHAHAMLPTWLAAGSAVVLVGLAVRPLRRAVIGR